MIIKNATLTLAIMAGVGIAVISPSSAAVTIGNSGFETPSIGAGALQYQPSGPGVDWTFTGNTGVTGNNSGFTFGNPNAPEGAQVGFLQTSGVFSQTLSGFDANTNYVFTFDAAQRGLGSSSHPSNQDSQDFNVFLDSTIIGTYNPVSQFYASFSTKAIHPGAGSHTLSFQGIDSLGDDETVFIDNVTVKASPVPEPSQTAAFGIGLLGLCGLMLVSRKRTTAR